MGFLEKVRNMFTEEIEDEEEVKVEKVDKVKKEIIASFNETNDDTIKEEVIPVKEEKEEPKPVFLDDDDFSDLTFSKKKDSYFDSNVKEPKEEKKQTKTREDKYVKKGNYKEMMKDSFSEEQETVSEEKKIFKPTPIISPIYGILDKNYHKEDIVSKKDRTSDGKEEPLIDQIRNKAYGTLEDELEDTLFGKNSVLNKSSDMDDEIEEVIPDTDDIDSLTDDISKDLDELLLKKELNKSKSNKSQEDDLLNFIDSTLYKDEGEEK